MLFIFRFVEKKLFDPHWPHPYTLRMIWNGSVESDMLITSG